MTHQVFIVGGVQLMTLEVMTLGIKKIASQVFHFAGYSKNEGALIGNSDSIVLRVIG